jgi:hypothetical protein
MQTMAADPSANPSSSPPRRRRRRDPITAPVLVRHVVFERPQVDRAIEARQADPKGEEPAGNEGSYAAVRRALHQLRQDVEALMKAQQLLAELETQVRRRTKTRG